MKYRRLFPNVFVVLQTESAMCRHCVAKVKDGRGRRQNGNRETDGNEQQEKERATKKATENMIFLS